MLLKVGEKMSEEGQRVCIVTDVLNVIAMKSASILHKFFFFFFHFVCLIMLLLWLPLQLMLLKESKQCILWMFIASFKQLSF